MSPGRCGYDARVWTSPFPEWVAFAALDESALSHARAHPEELATLSAAAVAKRRREFTLGRIAARQAIEALGRAPTPILVGHNREPLWPEELRGSITHSAGWAAAAVAPAERTANLGLDLEDSGAITPGIEGAVTDAIERGWTGGDPVRVAKLFSAKESVFKAFHRFRRAYFGFDAVRLRWTGAGFEATLLEAMAPDWPAGARVDIGCIQEGALVLSFLVLPPA